MVDVDEFVADRDVAMGEWDRHGNHDAISRSGVSHTSFTGGGGAENRRVAGTVLGVGGVTVLSPTGGAVGGRPRGNPWEVTGVVFAAFVHGGGRLICCGSGGCVVEDVECASVSESEVGETTGPLGLEALEREVFEALWSESSIKVKRDEADDCQQ